MAMIGADIGDLNNTSTNFQGFSETARTSGTTVVSTARRAVGNIEGETNTAEASIIDALESMRTGMTNANASMQGAQYVGRNAEVARNASTELDGRVAQAVTEVTEAFQDFRTRIAALGGELEGIASDFDAYAATVAESGAGFSQAMTNQATNLDAVMNQGIAVG
ncbi:MAG: hypothetical protein AAF467_20355 [Actinomycetota bacterium]